MRHATQPRDDHLLDAVKPLRITENMSVAELVEGLSGCAFGAGRLAAAAGIYREMVGDEECRVFLALAGAMVPAGMRTLISDEIRAGNIDVLVSTGANLVHDIIEALGLPHYKGSDAVDDVELRREEINRIYDVFLPEHYFSRFEEWLHDNVFTHLPRVVSIRELCSRIGARLEDEDSILKSAHDMQVPVFSPAIQDSILGLQAWLHRQTSRFTLDALADMQELIDLCYEAERTGVVIIGGGVPKNFILQSMLVTPGDFDYAIQLTMDRPETGGLSGATLDEARSWGKIGEHAKSVTVYSDATITLPLIMAAARGRQ